ncbi:uncharacterized protein L203_101722 [Cryptococcus depauperatus CBS 7841]|uniref:Zn(2)-C6 fungal-type domain-containing protein n=1 Tax=Cryptococcus depauperatus CBS 7841 TaxID=1295531 RepID=A0AAJ8JQC3_9TREE
MLMGPSERSYSFSEVKKPLVQSAVSFACMPCRGKKIKCDSSKPYCKNCAKNPEACFYPARMKPGLRPGTGMETLRRIGFLEERMEAYEARLAEQEARLSQLPMVPPFSYDRNHTPLSNPGMSNQKIAGDGMPSGPQVSMSTVTVHGLPSVNQPMSGVIPNPNAFSGNPSPSTSTHTFEQTSFHMPTSPNATQSSPASFVDPHILPPDDIVRDLINLFFTHIHPWAPILSPALPDLYPPWNIVHHAIVVVSLRLSRDPRIATVKEPIKQKAKQHVLAHAVESTSIASLQALAVLALDLIGSDQGPSSWGILALLTRSAVHLGLSSEEDTNPWMGRALVPSLSRTSIIPPPSNWHEDESRRRLFWLIFVLDRYVCVSTGWDFALPDFDIKRRLPCSDAIWAQSEWYQAPLFISAFHKSHTGHNLENISPMAYLVEALDLLGRAHTLQSEKIALGDAKALDAKKEMTVALTMATTRWFANRHISLIHPEGMRFMIRSIHYATLLKLNAYYAFPALSNGEPQEPYLSTCLSSARSMAKLVESARRIGWATASSPLFIWGCWVAARVLFVHTYLSHQTQPDKDFELIVSTLKEQAEYWALATQYVKLLERAKRKWLDTITQPNSNHALPEAIHVLLDLRRTAYSAVHTNMHETPFVSPPEPDLSQLPAWAVEPGLNDLYSWFDLPAGFFQAESHGSGV